MSVLLLALVAAASAAAEPRSRVLASHFRSMHAARAAPDHDPSSTEHLSLATLRALARTPLAHLLEGETAAAGDDAFRALLRHESTRRDETAESGRYLACAPLDLAAEARARLPRLAADQHRPLYADKRNNAACWWTSQMSARAARDLHREDSPFMYVVPMPTAAKLDADLFPTPRLGEHLASASVVVVLDTRHETARASEAASLVGRWAARGWGLSPPHDRDWLHHFYFTSDEGSRRHPAWASVRAALSLGACAPPAVRSTHPNRISLALSEDERCALAAVAFLAAQPQVLSIHRQKSRLSRSKVSQPRGYVQPANEVGAETLQSGTTDVLPLWEHGINGTGMFVAVSDTGFDDASCWLRDTDSRTTMSCASIDATCAESDGGAVDPYGDGCSNYISGWCGGYDDDDFSSDAMCCACGGGTVSGDVTGATDCFSSAQVARSSYDSPVTDFTKRKVVQYVGYPFGTSAAICKLYDEEAGGHGTHCAGTIAGNIARDGDYNASICELHREILSLEYCSATTCTADTNNGATDVDGWDCADFTSSPSWCGSYYDDDDFTANEMCCACGGGSRECTEASAEQCPLGEGSAEEKGMAPEAKLMVFDFLLGSSDPGCDGSQPNEHSTETWKPAYDAGARISSNSWASTLGDYGSEENDVDNFIYEKDDILILIAASNDGSFGPAGASARDHKPPPPRDTARVLSRAARLDVARPGAPRAFTRHAT